MMMMILIIMIKVIEIVIATVMIIMKGHSLSNDGHFFKMKTLRSGNEGNYASLHLSCCLKILKVAIVFLSFPSIENEEQRLKIPPYQ